MDDRDKKDAAKAFGDVMGRAEKLRKGMKGKVMTLAALRLAESLDGRQYDRLIEACLLKDNRDKATLGEVFALILPEIGVEQYERRVEECEDTLVSSDATSRGDKGRSLLDVSPKQVDKLRERLRQAEASDTTPEPCPTLARLVQIADGTKTSASDSTGAIALHGWASQEWSRIHVKHKLKEPTL